MPTIAEYPESNGRGRPADAIRSPFKMTQEARDTSVKPRKNEKRAQSKKTSGRAPPSPSEAPLRRSSFLARVEAQLREQQRHLARRQQQHGQQKERPTCGTLPAFLKFKTTSKIAPAAKPESPPPAKEGSGFAMDSMQLRPAPDGLHYIEDSGQRAAVVGGVDEQESRTPLTVLLVHRRRRSRPAADPADDPGATHREGEDDEEGEEEEVVVRHVPMADILAALRAQPHTDASLSGGTAGIRRAHDGVEGVTSMHLEVTEDVSFLPAALKALPREGGRNPSGAEDRGTEGCHAGEASTSSFPIPASGPPRPGAEPPVYDYFIPPTMRTVELLREKHKGGLSYLRHKLSYTKRELQEMSREDCRSYLACERRFLFMHQLQRDLDRRLENERRARRHQARQRREWERLHPRALVDRGEGASAGPARPPPYPTEEWAGPGFQGNNLYVVGREIPPEMVQTFFSLNEEYEAFQRSLERQQARQRRGSRTVTTTARAPTVSSPGTSAGSSMVRWGDALLFPGQRPAEGMVVITAGPRGMRGWRRVLTGETGGSAQRQRRGQGHAQQQRNGGVTVNRHIDLYAMAQRTSADPPNREEPRSHPAGVGGARAGRCECTSRRAATAAAPLHEGEEVEEEEEEDAGDVGYRNHFRYQLFYADESDDNSDEDLLCGEASAAEGSEGCGPASGQRPSALDGPVTYGRGYYIPRV